MGDIFLLGQNQCHVTGVKVLFWPYLSFGTKKIFCRVGGVKGDFSVNLCPFSYLYRHTDTEMDTELDNLPNHPS